MAGRDYRSILSASEYEKAYSYEKYIRTTMKNIRRLFADKETATRVENTLIEYNWYYEVALSLRAQHEAKNKVVLDLVKKYRNAPTDAEARKYLKQYNARKQELDALAKEYSHYQVLCVKMDAETRKCDALFVGKCKEAKADKDFESFMNKYSGGRK